MQGRDGNSEGSVQARALRSHLNFTNDLEILFCLTGASEEFEQ